jgi:hypothetical protein
MLYYVIYIYIQILTKICTIETTTNLSIFNYLLLYVLMEFRVKLPEYGVSAEACKS